MLEVNEIEYCKVNVKYTADPQVVIQKTGEAIKQLKALPVPGFRPGKATDLAIKARYKLRIEDWVKREMINHSHEEILFETKMETIGEPQTLNMRLDGNNFSCEMVLLKKPAFELKNVKGIEIPSPHESVTSAQYVQELLQELRTTNGDSRPYDDGDFVQLKDVVTMDYTVDGTINQGVLYTVGNNILPEFDDNILGMAAGETREFNLLINNVKTSVSATIHMGMKKTPAPLDDSLAQKLGLKTIAELQSTVEGIAGSRLKQHKDTQIADQISKRLLADHNFEIPAFLQDAELQLLVQKMNIKLDEVTDEVKANLIERAKNSIKFVLILDAIRKNDPSSDLTDEEIINMIKQRVLQQGQDPNQFLMESQKNGTLFQTVSQMRNEATLQFLIDNAKLID